MRRVFLLLPVPLRIMDVAYANGTAEILLDSILDVMSTEAFSKDKAAYIVGGEKKLLRLIEAGRLIAISRLIAKMVNGDAMPLRF